MKSLKDILYRAGTEEIIGNTGVSLRSVCFDSRKADAGCAFVAVRGTQVDGHEYIDTAIEKGAVAIICEDIPSTTLHGITYVRVKDSGEALGWLAANYFGNPSEKISLIGITGTNGKTTIATLLYELFGKLGYKAGLISTVRNKIGEEEIDATHTTPDPLQLNYLLQRMLKENCTHCFMEVSSHAIHQRRIAGLDFNGGVFTNITRDHLDYHKTFKDYINAKKLFFDLLSSEAFALFNKDDKHHKILAQNCRALKKTFSLMSAADFRCKILENNFSGLTLNIDGREVWIKLAGNFNASNILAVYAVAQLLGEEPMQVLTAISELDPVQGRFQRISSKTGITAIVDYAHTPDALLNVIETILDIRSDDQKLITVIGCGGDRDKGKRPLMAKVATGGSDRVILTSDNPRSEDANVIIAEMKSGIESGNEEKTIVITDRKEAIKTACALASVGDIVLVAGKGHENYQEIKGVRQPFDDAEIIKTIFQTQTN